MRQFCQDNEDSQRSLMERAERASDLFLNTRSQNWRLEQNLREKQAQVTHNLQTWLAKYDIDMTEKTQELNEQTDTWNEVLAKFTDWKTNKFDQQTKEYERLMQEKSDDEKRAQHEQMMIFMMNRSARIIQRYWREYMAKKKKAKGKSKGKGKKK
jgi:ATP-dependent Clp protease ATP-binding subunit ClpA